jgi:hypothetical protein
MVEMNGKKKISNKKECCNDYHASEIIMMLPVGLYWFGKFLVIFGLLGFLLLFFLWLYHFGIFGAMIVLGASLMFFGGACVELKRLVMK